jgi:hypothetical protein
MQTVSPPRSNKESKSSMNLLPEYSFELNYRVTPDELLDKLRQNVVKPRGIIKISKNGKQFTGIVAEDSFELYLWNRYEPSLRNWYKRSWYKTSLPLMIIGKVYATPYGTKIVIRIHYNKLESAFSIALLAILFFFFGREISTYFIKFSFITLEVSSNVIGLISAIGVVSYLYILLWLFFNSESSKSIKALKNIFLLPKTL